jgi:gliding motility-associated-like protein
MKKIALSLLLSVLFFITQASSASAQLQTGPGTPPHDSLSIVVPNVFTPNDDGINDTWSMIVHDYGITIFELQTIVYDRWGKEVFQTTNIHEVWSGHSQIGKACSSGSYFYVISYINSGTGSRETLKGFIELLR